MNENSALQESRLKILSVNPLLFLDMLNWCNSPSAIYSLPVTPEIPEGTFVVSIDEDHWSRCMMLTLCHPSFEVVPAGEQIPRIASLSERVVYKKETDRTDRDRGIELVLSLIRNMPDDERRDLGILIKTFGGPGQSEDYAREKDEQAIRDTLTINSERQFP